MREFSLRVSREKWKKQKLFLRREKGKKQKLFPGTRAGWPKRLPNERILIASE